MFKARTIRCYQFAARTIFQAVKERYFFCFFCWRYLLLAARTIISCKYYYFSHLLWRNVLCSIQDGSLNKWQKNVQLSFTTSPYKYLMYRGYSRPILFLSEHYLIKTFYTVPTIPSLVIEKNCKLKLLNIMCEYSNNYCRNNGKLSVIQWKRKKRISWEMFSAVGCFTKGVERMGNF